MPFLVIVKQAFGFHHVIRDFKAVERLWIKNVLHAPSKDIVEIAKHVSQNVGSVTLRPVQPEYIVEYGTALCERNRFRRSSVIRYRQGSFLTAKEAAHEFLHAIQNRFRKLMILRTMFFPSHRKAMRAYRGIGHILDEVAKGKLSPQLAHQQIANLLNNLSLKALKVLKKVTLNEIQAYTLTKRYSLPLQMTAEDIAQDKLNLDIYKGTNRLIRQAERLKSNHF